MKITIEAESLEELKSLLEQLTSGKLPATNQNCHLNALPINERTRNGLLAHGIETLAQLAMLSEREVNGIPNIGKKAASEIRGLLNARVSA
jgi:DNA-directed RNA polymerase alpha subunit